MSKRSVAEKLWGVTAQCPTYLRILAVALVALLPSSVYGGDAIVFDQVTGVWSVIYSDETQWIQEADARAKAMKECTQRGGKRCELVCGSGTTKHVAFAGGWNPKSKAYALACDVGRSREEAIQKAMHVCTEENFSTKTPCQLLHAYHTIGDPEVSSGSAR
jgi:hypothetical protein